MLITNERIINKSFNMFAFVQKYHDINITCINPAKTMLINLQNEKLPLCRRE